MAGAKEKELEREERGGRPLRLGAGVGGENEGIEGFEDGLGGVNMIYAHL